jgi:hypothetical protein
VDREQKIEQRKQRERWTSQTREKKGIPSLWNIETCHETREERDEREEKG